MPVHSILEDSSCWFKLHSFETSACLNLQQKCSVALELSVVDGGSQACLNTPDFLILGQLHSNTLNMILLNHNPLDFYQSHLSVSKQTHGAPWWNWKQK